MMDDEAYADAVNLDWADQRIEELEEALAAAEAERDRLRRALEAIRFGNWADATPDVRVTINIAKRLSVWARRVLANKSMYATTAEAESPAPASEDQPAR